MLSSTQNPTVKHLVRMRDNRARQRARRVLVDGWRETHQALSAGLNPVGIFHCPTSPAVTDSQSETEQRVITQAGDKVVRVSETVMEKIAYGQSSRGVVSEFESPDWDLERLPDPTSGLVLVLDQIEKPGNIGAAFHCADAAGVDAVLLTPSTADRFNPNAIRSSLGAVFSVPSAATDEADARHWLRQRGFTLCAARVESACPLWDADLGGSVAIIVGSEALGLAERWQTTPDSPVTGVRIPMAGSVDSLNASVSAAVLLYEAARQKATRP